MYTQNKRAASNAPHNKLPEGARVLSPQKVDLNHEKRKPVQPILGKSESQKHMAGHMKSQTAGGGPRIRFEESPSHRKSSSEDERGTDNAKSWGDAVKTFNPRPGTENSPGSRKLGTRKTSGSKNEFKIKKMHSLLPWQKNGNDNGPNEANFAVETVKEDREAVEDLERWDNEFKIMTMSKAMETDQKKPDGNQLHLSGDQFEAYKTPALNREIIHLLDGDAAHNSNGKFNSAVSNIHKKVRVPQKSLETIMTEYNKKILNEILYQRVSKKLNIRDAAATGQNKMDLDYTTKTVSTDTISNFKNLQSTIQTNPRIIEYDNLYQKLNQRRIAPEKIFNFDEDKKRIQEAENDYAAIDANLKIQFESVIVEIHRKKEHLSELRLVVHKNNEETKTIELDIEDLTKKFEALEYQYNQQREMNRSINRNSRTTNKKVGVKEAPRQMGFVDEFSKIQRQMDDKKEQIRELRDQLATLEADTQKSQQKLSNLDREIRDLKFKKHQLRLQLKQLYLKILKNEEHIFKNEASFISVIKSMWRINEEIIEDMFPPFVDKDALTYLIENARLEYELEQLQEMAKNEGISSQQRDPQQREEVVNRFQRTQDSLKAPLSEQLFDVKKRLQSLKKGIVKMKRPVFMKDGGARSRIIRWEELSLESEDIDEQFLDEQFIQERISRAISSIRIKLAELREKEINRIFTQFINKEIEEKNLKNLNKLLISLFGRQTAEKIYLKFVRLKQTHDFKITQNKTFVFASTKQFSNSVLSDKTKNSVNLMLSYAANFRPEKLKSQIELYEESLVEEKKKEDQKSFTEEIHNYEEVANMEVNYNYNLNYNYAQELASEDLRGSFYVNKIPLSPQGNDAMSGKSSMRDPTRMSKSKDSFYKVTFKEGTKESEASTIGKVPKSQLSRIASRA